LPQVFTLPPNSLYIAACFNSQEVIQKLWEDRYTDFNGCNSKGFSALHICAQFNCVESAKILLDSGVAIDKDAVETAANCSCLVFMKLLLA